MNTSGSTKESEFERYAKAVENCDWTYLFNNASENKPFREKVAALLRSAQPDEPAECKDCDKLMTERDDATEQADKLAECIEGLLGIEIGEHSSGNAPWQNAIDAAEYELDKRKRNAETKGENNGT